MHYTLKLSIDPKNNTLSGDCTIEAQATQPLSAFNLDFSGLTIEQVIVNGMNFHYGADPQNTTPVKNDLQDVILEFWARNTVRPSNFDPTP